MKSFAKDYSPHTMDTKKSIDFSSSSTRRRLLAYDVFISFRGEDTRNSFASHVCAALSKKHINFFINNELVGRGNEISGSLLKAIETSQIYLVIFSPNYGSSRWCLVELENILICRRQHGKKVIPVFYKVHPSDVRNQTGSFGSRKHEGSDEAEKVLRWRAALKEATDVKGLDLKDHKLESELIDEIVAAILWELKSIHIAYNSNQSVRSRTSVEDDNSSSYDVFISYRGEDIRTNFISHLCTALSMKHIKAFNDNKDLRAGHEISGSLLEAIETSQLYLVIFSPDYGSSRWCLIELENILLYSRQHGKKVVPVFYKVDPSQVRNQTGSFGINFARKHEGIVEIETEKMLKWRAALKEAANMSGFALNDNKPEPEFIDDIVAAILRELKSIHLPYNSNQSGSAEVNTAMDDRAVMRHLRDDNNINSWVCQFCRAPFPYDVHPEVIRHHLTWNCERAPEDVKEAAAQRREEEAAEFSSSINWEPTRTLDASESMDCNFEAETESNMRQRSNKRQRSTPDLGTDENSVCK